jgi:hypothetical protein
MEHKPIISLQSELHEIQKQEGTEPHSRAMRELQQQLRTFHANTNVDPAESLAEKWRVDKCGRPWTRDKVANLVSHALKVRKEVDGLNDEAWELFLSVITTGETPTWYDDWK